MKRFSPRLLAIGFVVGALGTAAILAAGAYARTPHHNGTSRRTGKRVVRRSRHTSRPMATAPLRYAADWQQLREQRSGRHR